MCFLDLDPMCSTSLDKLELQEFSLESYTSDMLNNKSRIYFKMHVKIHYNKRNLKSPKCIF